jgi:hypothetical protein
MLASKDRGQGEYPPQFIFKYSNNINIFVIYYSVGEMSLQKVD